MSSVDSRDLYESTVNPAVLTLHQLRQILLRWNRSTGGSLAELRRRFAEEQQRRRALPEAPRHISTDPVSRKRKADEASRTEDRSQEKRQCRFRSRPTVKIRERLERAKTQRMFLVECSEIPGPDTDEGDLRCSFVVLGSTGNVYTVNIDRRPSCTCPDHVKRQSMCKHILFVLLKVMGVRPDCPLAYQDAWIGTELRQMFHDFSRRWESVRGNGIVARKSVRDAYAGIKTGRVKDEDDRGHDRIRKKLEDDDECPVCFDPLPTDPAKCTYCKAQCGANFHVICIRSWLSSQPSNCQKCPLCRAGWEGDGSSIGRHGIDSGYTNLGRLQGQPTTRDTSTYNPFFS